MSARPTGRRSQNQRPAPLVQGHECRVLLLQTIHANRLHEFEAACAKLKEIAPGCSISAVITPEIHDLVAGLGCVHALMVSMPRRRLALLRDIRTARFSAACIVSDGSGAPGQIRNDIMALAAWPRQLWWCVPGEDIVALSRTRLMLRVAGELVLAVIAMGIGSAVGILAAAALVVTGLLGCACRRRAAAVTSSMADR